jgi:hypothetical protein
MSCCSARLQRPHGRRRQVSQWSHTRATSYRAASGSGGILRHTHAHTRTQAWRAAAAVAAAAGATTAVGSAGAPAAATAPTGATTAAAAAATTTRGVTEAVCRRSGDPSSVLITLLQPFRERYRQARRTRRARRPLTAVLIPTSQLDQLTGAGACCSPRCAIVASLQPRALRAEHGLTPLEASPTVKSIIIVRAETPRCCGERFDDRPAEAAFRSSGKSTSWAATSVCQKRAPGAHRLSVDALFNTGHPLLTV